MVVLFSFNGAHRERKSPKIHLNTVSLNNIVIQTCPLDQFLLNNLWINSKISTPVLCCMGGWVYNGFCVEHSERVCCLK